MAFVFTAILGIGSLFVHMRTDFASMREAMTMYRTNPLFKFVTALSLLVLDTFVVNLAYYHSNSNIKKRFWCTVAIGIALETILALSLFLWDEPFLTVSEVLCPRSSTGALCSPCICTPGRTVGASPRGPRSRNSFIHQILLYGFLDASMIFRKKYSSSGRP